MKSNFKTPKDNDKNNDTAKVENSDVLSKEEFEQFIINSGAKGSFMIFRSNKKDDELGIDEL